jgi:hypothetical protein
VSDLIDMHIDHVSNYHRCWLDLASHGLTFNFNASCSSPPPPTIILVDSLAADLALFWTLRSATQAHFPPWLIPIPVTTTVDHALAAKLKEWFLAFEIYQCRPTFFRVTSTSVPAETLADFAGRLQDVFKGTAIKLERFARGCSGP